MKNKFFTEVFLNGRKYNDFLNDNLNCIKQDLSKWYEELKQEKDIVLIKRLRSLYNAKDFLKNEVRFDQFYNWYLSQEQHCEYCKITQNELDILLDENNPLISYTREGRRGRKLEIDRKNSKIEYGKDLNNLVLCCYWCNNAKTDEFSAEEFKPIGIAIGNILRNRLKIKK